MLFTACEALQLAGEKLTELSLPCPSIGASLCAVRRSLPHVSSLMLRVDEMTEVDALDDLSEDEEESEIEVGLYEHSQLKTLSLQAQPGIPPVCILNYECELPLQLLQYPKLQHLILTGPIIRCPDEPSNGLVSAFLLPPDTLVSVLEKTTRVCICDRSLWIDLKDVVEHHKQMSSCHTRASFCYVMLSIKSNDRYT